jgi:hypothetical protein
VAAGASAATCAAFATGTAFAATAADAVVTWGAVVAVAAGAARIVGCHAGTAGMHNGFPTDGVRARGGSGAQRGQCRSQNHAGSRTHACGINNLV